MDTYQNKIALVTGASTGIGRAMAIDLAAKGAELILTARSKEQLDALAQEIQGKGGMAHVFVEDLAQPGSGERLHQQILAAGLDVDLLINNAGYGRWGQFGEFQRDDYAAMIQLNITSLTDLCHLFMPAMVKKGEGGVINIGSSASFLPVPYATVYSSRGTAIAEQELKCPFPPFTVSVRTLARVAPDSPPARQKGTGLWAVRAL